MSEYIERINVSRLIGAAPGYIGHDEPGQLTEALRRRPHAVVLLDEVEKAHPQVLDLFLQLFDEGRLTDSHGRSVDGRHAVYIMTSNAVSVPDTPDSGTDQAEDEITSAAQRFFLRESLQTHFRAEFLNRIDHTVIFRNLSEAHLHRITQLEIEHVVERLQEQDVHLTVDTAIYDHITDQAVGVPGAARRVQSLVAEQIALPISKALLAENQPAAVSVRVSVQHSHIKVLVNT